MSNFLARRNAVLAKDKYERQLKARGAMETMATNFREALVAAFNLGQFAQAGFPTTDEGHKCLADSLQCLKKLEANGALPPEMQKIKAEFIEKIKSALNIREKLSSE